MSYCLLCGFTVPSCVVIPVYFFIRVYKLSNAVLIGKVTVTCLSSQHQESVVSREQNHFFLVHLWRLFHLQMTEKSSEFVRNRFMEYNEKYKFTVAHSYHLFSQVKEA